jgi:poly-gamma-glutamate capsule biosynthesis protein CapA/YwtB (metallophosphatase superfamily)
MADLGADVVIGTQAHWPQTIEFYTASDGRDVFIHYGLGNLFFDQTGGAYPQFLMDELLIQDGRLLGITLHPGIIEGLARPRWMTPDEAEIFLREIFRESGF